MISDAVNEADKLATQNNATNDKDSGNWYVANISRMKLNYVISWNIFET